MKKLNVFLRFHLGGISRKIRNIFLRIKFNRYIGDDNFTIISQNCIGTMIYHDLGIRFNSPTINLYMESQDFIKFIENLDYYLSIDAKKIKFITSDDYPIGYLEDLKIYFVHYSNENEVIKCWNRRRKRVNFNKIYIIMTDRDGCNEEIINRYDNAIYENKLFFSNKPLNKKTLKIIYMPCFKKLKTVGSLTEFSNIFGKRYYEKYFDYIDWLR